MKRLEAPIEANGYVIRGVSDWLCYMTDANGRWFSFWTECDDQWIGLPPHLRRWAVGLDEGTTEADAAEADDAIVEVGRRKLMLGHAPEPVDDEFVDEIQKALA